LKILFITNFIVNVQSMAACGAQACAQEVKEEKVDQPKRLFNYEATGERAAEYKKMPDCDDENMTLEGYVESNRKMLAGAMAVVARIPMFADAVTKVEISKLVVEKSKICDEDTTVYCLSPKNLPKKDCPAMIFCHGGPGVAGTALQFNPLYCFAALHYGVVGFNVEYQLAPEGRNKGSSDVYAVLKYVYDNAEKLGIDKTKIGMEGNSAGAHHMFNACYLMAQNNDTGMCKMMISEIGFFPSYIVFTDKKDLQLEEEKLGVGKFDYVLQALAGDDYKEYSAAKHPMLFPDLAEEKILKDYPPVAFFSPEFCFFNKATKAFSERLEKVGKLLEFRLIRGLGHMYTLAQNKEVADVFKDRVICVNVYLKQ